MRRNPPRASAQRAQTQWRQMLPKIRKPPRQRLRITVSFVLKHYAVHRGAAMDLLENVYGQPILESGTAREPIPMSVRSMIVMNTLDGYTLPEHWTDMYGQIVPNAYGHGLHQFSQFIDGYRLVPTELLKEMLASQLMTQEQKHAFVQHQLKTMFAYNWKQSARIENVKVLVEYVNTEDQLRNDRTPYYLSG